MFPRDSAAGRIQKFLHAIPFTDFTISSLSRPIQRLRDCSELLEARRQVSGLKQTVHGVDFSLETSEFPLKIRYLQSEQELMQSEHVGRLLYRMQSQGFRNSDRPQGMGEGSFGFLVVVIEELRLENHNRLSKTIVDSC